MGCCVRMMSREDIPQVTAIDREAFPTQLPSPDYNHELQNKLARYVVVTKECAQNGEEKAGVEPRRGIQGLACRLKHALSTESQDDELLALKRDYVMGFAGFWLLADEAHITSIAVREEYQRRGMGELLLIALMELARERGASMVTLEVRISNTGAQTLYTKYGFVEVGVRKGYYTDNSEDALLMTLKNVSSDAVGANLERLKQAHARKCGKEMDIYQIAHI